MYTPRQFYNGHRMNPRERQTLRTLPLRQANNFLKSLIIQKYVSKGDRILDIGGGKGGDLQKYHHAGVSSVILTDIAEDSLREARYRYERGRQYRFTFSAQVLDFREPFGCLWGCDFQVVISMFSLHYAFRTRDIGLRALQSIAINLKPRGKFIAIVPDSGQVKVGIDNSICKISNLEGRSYTFYLEDAVDHVEEYLVDSEELVESANQVGLTLEDTKLLTEMWDEAEDHSLKAKMVHETPDADMMEVIGLYRCWIFRKC